MLCFGTYSCMEMIADVVFILNPYFLSLPHPYHTSETTEVKGLGEQKKEWEK